jgi:hypothetical protein
MPANSPVTFEHYRGRLWTKKKKEKRKKTQKQKPEQNRRRRMPSRATARVKHAPPPRTSLFSKRPLETPELPKLHQPRPRRQAVTLTRRSKEWPPWPVLAKFWAGTTDTVEAGGLLDRKKLTTIVERYVCWKT